jgi:hypothetical protein
VDRTLWAPGLPHGKFLVACIAVIAAICLNALRFSETSRGTQNAIGSQFYFLELELAPEARLNPGGVVFDHR